MTKRKTIVLLSIILAVVLAGVGVLLFFLNMAPKQGETERQIKESSIGQEIIDITNLNDSPAASLVIAPSTSDWWSILSLYTQNDTVYTLDYAKYAKNSSYIAYTLSTGANWQGYGYLGLPTTFIIYNTPEDAANAKALLDADGVSHQLVGNMIFFVPEGAASDVDYALDQYKTVEGETLNLNGKAMMFMTYPSLEAVLTQGTPPVTLQTFRLLAASLGVSPETTWSGTSSDGLNWVGSFSGKFDTNSLASPTDIENALGSRYYYLQEDGTYATADKATDKSVLVTGQAALFSTGALIIRNNEVGTQFQETTDDNQTVTVQAQPLPADEGIYQVVLKPDEVISAFLTNGQETNEYTTFSQAVVTVQKDGSSTLRLVLKDKILNPDSNE